MLDLRNGQIKFTITPTNVLTNFDLTQFNMAQMIQVTGTVANPKVSLNPVSVGAMGVSVAKMAGLASGLPAIVAITAGSELDPTKTVNPCKTALGQ